MMLFASESPATEVPPTVQDRAYPRPVWYTPAS